MQMHPDISLITARAVARTIIGGGGVYSYIQVLLIQVLVSFEIKLISKEVSRA